MLRTIELPAGAPPEQCADAFLPAWDRGLVFHIRGPKPDMDLRDYYGRLMALAGEPARLAEDASIGDRHHQRTQEVWMEVRYDPSVTNAYRHSNQPQPLHTDGSYIPTFPSAGLLACVSQASAGGETVFLDGRVLVEIMANHAPTLLADLTSVPVPHGRSGDRKVTTVIQIPGGNRDQVLLNWNYYCVEPNSGDDVQALRAQFFSFLAEDHAVAAATLPVRLEAGEALIWKDDRVLHGRNGFTPQAVSERFFWKAAFEVRPGRADRTSNSAAHVTA